MKTMPLSEVKMKLSSLVDAVGDTDDEIMITKNGRPAAVLISPDEFDSYTETTAVLGDADFVAEIKRGLAALKNGKAQLYTLEELLDTPLK